jgi:4-amino-4-deoxy-L-arabinose transferase-like glycosyltransferase
MKKLVPLVLLIFFSLIFGSLIYKFVILPAPTSPFNFEEAFHALRGLLIAHDLKNRDWVSFLYDTYRQTFLPPLYSWYTGIAYSIAGPGIIVARVTSLIAFIMTSIVLYLASTQMRKDQGELSGIIAGILFLTSPGLVALAAQAMIEVTGLLAIGVTFLIHFKLTNDNSSPKKYMLLGICIAVTYFFKMNYGILLIMSLVITQLIKARFHLHRLLTPYNFYTAMPILITFAIWYAYPPKLIITWQALVNYPVGVSDPFTVEGLIYYPRAILRLSGSIWLFSILVISTLFALKFWHDEKVRLLLIFVFIQFLLAEFHQTKVDREICPIMLPLYLLTGYVIAELWHRFNQTDKILKFWLPRLLTGVLMLYAINLFISTLRTYSPVIARREATKQSLTSKTNSGNKVINSYVANAVRKTGTTLIIGMMDKSYPNPTALDWYLITEEHLMSPPQAGSLQQIEEERKIVSTLTRYKAPTWFMDLMLPSLTRSERPGAMRTLYFGHPPNTNYSRSQSGFLDFLLDTLKENTFDGVVIITSITGQAPYDLAFINPIILKAGLHLISTKEFEDSDIRVDVYKM